MPAWNFSRFQLELTEEETAELTKAVNNVHQANVKKLNADNKVPNDVQAISFVHLTTGRFIKLGVRSFVTNVKGEPVGQQHLFLLRTATADQFLDAYLDKKQKQEELEVAEAAERQERIERMKRYTAAPSVCSTPELKVEQECPAPNPAE